MVVSVTPWSVAPFASPGPHTLFRSPKSPALVELPDALVVPELPFELLLERLHPAIATATTSNATDQRALLTTAPPGIGDQASTGSVGGSFS
jgi:hypothetical protein